MSAKPPELERFRPALAHLDVLACLYGDERVVATLWPEDPKGTRTAEQCVELMEADERHWDLYGFGPWLYRLSDGAPAARGGLKHVVIDGAAAVEVGYSVASALWGRGIATAIAREATAEAFRALGLDELVCFTLPTNTASRRVMEKAGFTYERDFMRAGLPHVLYRLTR